MLWDKIRTTTDAEWYAAGAVSVEREGWLTYISASNGSWALIGRVSMTIGYGVSAWIVVGAEDVNADGLHLAVQLCPKRCAAILSVVMRVIEEGQR